MKEVNLKGLITIKDIEKQIKYPLSAKGCIREDCCAVQRSVLLPMYWIVWKHW